MMLNRRHFAAVVTCGGIWLGWLPAPRAVHAREQTTADDAQNTQNTLDTRGAQDASPHQHMHMPMDMETSTGWQFMQDGVLFGLFNHQAGLRGGDEMKAPNWWMGMATRPVGPSRLTLNAMFSLDPATAGERGYADLFQVGEALHGRPLIDRQHPHDFFMQLAAIWRTPIGQKTGLTVAGGPAGEPALGPVAFMHRASMAEYPFAPLGHHTLDSTHISYGVVTAAVDHGPWVVEGSIFNGREPDEDRWDFDFGPLDSVSGRVWFRPTERWEFQVSTGHLIHPEELEPGDIQRTTASASWFGRRGTDSTAVTVGYGVNATTDGRRQAMFAEATRHSGRVSLFGRAETLQVETNLLLTDAIPTARDAAARKDTVAAFTVGGVRDLPPWHGFEAGLGAALAWYLVPDALEATYGDHPVSFQIYVRIRPPASHMGRMWNMRMARPMERSRPGSHGS
jgi:hypothetical protein